MTVTTTTPRDPAFSGATAPRPADRPAHRPSHRPDPQRFLDRLCRALTHGDTAKLVSCWDVPAFVVTDDGVRGVATADEIAQLFGATKLGYDARGVTDMKAEIEAQRWLSDRIVAVEVRWPWFSAGGAPVGEERASYVLRIDDHGHLRLHVAIVRASP